MRPAVRPVVDAPGAVVLEDGAALDLPDAGWPDLHGHMVCPGPSTLTVLDEAPPIGRAGSRGMA